MTLALVLLALAADLPAEVHRVRSPSGDMLAGVAEHTDSDEGACVFVRWRGDWICDADVYLRVAGRRALRAGGSRLVGVE